ncbi:MAG: hypothetical protein ACRCSK_00180 [Fusobacteriaceae bacterium]
MKIGSKFFSMKRRLFSVKEGEQLNFFSILIVILLDIFILTNIFRGVGSQVRLIKTSDEYFSYSCKTLLFVDKKINDDIIVDINRASDRIYGGEKTIDSIQPVCKDIEMSLTAIEKNKTLKNDLRYYNTEKNNDTYVEKSKKIKEVKKNILKASEIKILIEKVERYKKSDGERLKKELEKIERWYDIKVYAMRLTYLGILFLAAFWFYIRSNKKSYSVKSFISAHLLAVSIIPLFYTVMDIFLDLIPRNLIRKLIETLEKLKIAGVWNYILIVLGILVAGIIIAIIQSKKLNAELTKKRRFINKRCFACGQKLRGDEEFCNFCGESQVKKCSHCGKNSHVIGDYCKHCGEKIN